MGWPEFFAQVSRRMENPSEGGDVTHRKSTKMMDSWAKGLMLMRRIGKKMVFPDENITAMTVIFGNEYDDGAEDVYHDAYVDDSNDNSIVNASNCNETNERHGMSDSNENMHGGDDEVIK